MLVATVTSSEFMFFVSVRLCFLPELGVLPFLASSLVRDLSVLFIIYLLSLPKVTKSLFLFSMSPTWGFYI